MIKRNAERSRRVNIYTLFRNIPVYIYLAIIPIMQNILYKPQKLREYITSYALSIIFTIAVIGISAADYMSKRYTSSLKYTYIQKGFPIRTRFCIPHEKLHSVIVQSSPISLLFSAVKIQLNTPATRAKKGDAMFYLSKKSADKLICEIYDDIGAELQSYRASNLRIFFMASIWSNPISGILIISPLIRSIGKIAGEQMSMALIESFDLSVYLMYIGLPPTTAIIAYFLLFCYAVSVCADFVRNANFRCTSYQNGILIKRGVIGSTFFLTNCQKLNAIFVNQSLLMLPFKLYSAYIHTVGSGKAKGDRSLLIAAESKENVYSLLHELLDGFDAKIEQFLKPAERALKSYLLLPFSLLIGCIAVYMASQKLHFLETLVFTVMTFIIPWLVLWAVFRIIAFRQSGFGYNGKFIRLKTYKRMTFTAAYIPINKVQLCVIRQNVLQRLGSTCSVRVYIYGEKRSFVEIKHLSSVQAEKLVKKINSDIK